MIGAAQSGQDRDEVPTLLLGTEYVSPAHPTRNLFEDTKLKEISLFTSGFRRHI
jgi:hypothetical protein